jgi:hypothetical protein
LLERFGRGKILVVNLPPETDAVTEFVSFGLPHALRVLARIMADLDELAGFLSFDEAEKAKAHGAAGNGWRGST